MSYQFFSKNGEILPADQAMVSLDDIAYAYGFGVYETIRLHKGIPYFAVQHWSRLLRSAATIRLEHQFDTGYLESSLTELVTANQASDANVKILLIGGRTSDDAVLTMQLLNPLYPDRKLYRDGAHAVTDRMERQYPQAKTLNMLPSYLAYREAQTAGAYDALLIDDAGMIREGTRTNFLAMQGRTIISPPADAILPGVMRQAVLQVAALNGFEVLEQPVPLTAISDYDAAFLTSTSSKIMPLRSIDNHTFASVSPELKDLMTSFQIFYDNCQGQLGEVH